MIGRGLGGHPVVLLAIAPLLAFHALPAVAGGSPALARANACAGWAAAASDYYALELVNTGRVAGARQASGEATVTFARSPFGLALGADGLYVHALTVQLRDLRAPRSGFYAVWVTTPELDRVELLGRVGEDLRVQGDVAWNKYLVVVSHEPDGGETGARWAGPVVLRGMSRSGRMHTMAGHGPFQAEPCAKYGF